MEIPEIEYEPIVRAALREDIGPGDITTNLCIPADAVATAHLVAKSPGIIAGMDIAALAFRLLDPAVDWNPRIVDGAVVGWKPSVIAEVSGSARSLLSAERVALNFLQRLSGIATMTARCVANIAGTQARIVDTRKTTPGLRVLEKYAVRIGGGYNHRIGLYDCILIKDNHLRAAGGVTRAVASARAQAGHTVKIEVEVTSLPQVEQALSARADIILLDNMDTDTMARAVRIIDGKAIVEASGGLNPDTVASVAATGVDILSVGALTHSAPAMDISLDFAH